MNHRMVRLDPHPRSTAPPFAGSSGQLPPGQCRTYSPGADQKFTLDGRFASERDGLMHV
jgi:hypothetical protein